jgi:acyl carrier protein
MGLQMLVPFLESEYNISIPDLELIPENFHNINMIANMVTRLSGNRGKI